MSKHEVLPVFNDGKEISHIEIDLETPEKDNRNDESCVLFLHGFGTHRYSDKAEFYRNRVLSAGLAYCSFDFQGHGSSGGEFKDLTLSRNLADTALVHEHLRSQGYSRIILIGSSMGGVTALWHALRHQDEIAAGLFLAPALNMTATAFMRSGEDVHSWQESGILKFEHRGIERELAWDFITDLERYPAGHLASDLDLPSLVAQGKQDVLIPWEFTETWVKQCSDKVRFRLFESGDHLLLEEQKEIWEHFHQLLVDERIIDTQTV